MPLYELNTKGTEHGTNRYNRTKYKGNTDQAVLTTGRDRQKRYQHRDRLFRPYAGGISKHGFFDLSVHAKGDLHVDGHHTVEDVGIVLGQAIRQAVGDKAGMKRFGYFILPMDDALALCAVDLGGRAYFSFDGEFQTERVGDFETQLVTEFFYALASNAQMNLHIRLLAGQNDHHKIEAIFKAFGKALDQAVSMDERISGVLSTKGSL